MALPGNLLGQIACEKLSTDYDRAAKAEEQEYVPGVVRSASAWPLLDYKEHDDEAKDKIAADATSNNDDHIGRKQATLLALYGLLMKRYMREPEIELAMVLDDGAWVGVPLHGIAGLKVSIVEAARQIHVLLRDRAPLDPVASAAASATDDGNLDTQAFVVRDNVLLPPPREWPHLSFTSPPPTFLADICLILEQDNFFTLLYNERLFSSTMMEAMMRCWETLLAHARQDMLMRQDLVPVVSPLDMERMVREWNQTETLFLPARQGIHELFEARVDEAPSRLAVVGPVSGAESDIDHYPTRVQELSYGELEQQANRLAHHLRRQGLLNQDIVGIFLERSVAFYVAMLGVLKAGGGYVSIDTDYPDDRIQFMLEDSGAVALVTTQALALRVQGKTVSPQRPFRLVLLDDSKHSAALAQEATTRPPPITMPKAIEAPCYVIYTSGSTGRPKGVQISHANALNLIQAEAHIYGMRPSDRVLQGFSTSFDASVEEIWMALHNGAALVVGTKELMRSGPDFPRYLEMLSVTCLSTVPTLLATLGAVEDGRDGDDGQVQLLPNVRLIITGGEACSKELMARWATNGRRFFNTYGPTEATVIATYKEYGATAASTNSVHRVTIGRPLPNYQCYVLDEHLNLLPPGALGELVIGGVSVSRVGYLNLPDKTRSVFKPDPFRPGKSDNYPLYQSGDLARISLARDTMGEIEYYGRTDTQVKIRGYRVEPSEIEAVLCGLPGIQSAVVDVQQQGPGTMKQLVAFVVLAGDKGTLSLDTAAVMQAMREKLPVFMIPSHIEPMVAFPTLPSGKLDRRRLPQVLRPASRRAFSKSLTRSLSRALGAGGVAVASVCGDVLMEEHNEHRRAVTGAFEQVLGLPAKTLTSPKATDADFFDLGGNSLLVSMLVTKLRRQYPAVAARDVYSHSTVGALADVLESLDTTAASAAAAATAALNKEEDAPCTTKSGDRNHALELERQLPASPSFYIPRMATTILADLVQLAAMYLVAAYMGLNGLSMYLLYFNYKDLPTLKLLALLAGVSIALIPLAFLVLVAAKWLVLGRVREGDYPLWQSYHLRFWFVQCLDSVFRLFYMASLEGTPLAAWYHWALGARIGRGVYLQGNLEGYDLVTIGDGCSLNCQANVSAVSIEGNYLKLRKVRLGQGVTLGVRAMVQPDVHLDDHCKIEALSLVPSATHVPSRQIWAGAPIAFVGFRHDIGSVATGTSAMVGTLQITWSVLGKAMAAVFLVPFLYLLRAAPVPSVTEDDPVATRRHEAGTTLLHVIWLSMVLQIGLFLANTCLVAGLKRLLLLGGLQEATTYPLTSWIFFRRWAVDNLMDSLAVYTKQLRGSLYLPLWYRLMGARMGHHAEISAFENVCAERLTLGDQVFVADDVMLGMPHVEDGVVTQHSVSIGNRTFVGNNSVVEGGTHLPNDVLVGVLTLPPSQTTGATTVPGETLLGCPPFRIQKRAELSRQAKSTYNPPSWMVFVRYVVEGVGFLLLQLSLATCFAMLYVTMTWCYNGDSSRTSLVTYLLTLPLFVIGEGVVAAVLTLFWKWVVIGRYRAGSYPLYGTYVWRTEFVERIEENLLHTYTYPLISGTVWMQLVNQAMGVQIGRRAYLEFPYFCEPDLCTVGDFCNMERTASLQAHLFQDRVRTTGPVKVGDFCSLGSDSVVLLGAVLGDHCALSSMSLVLRSEELPSHTQWHGLPAVKLLPGVGAAPKYDEEDARGQGGVAVEAAGRLGRAE
jgi:non-ribosomal peptide synthetase-like protein